MHNIYMRDSTKNERRARGRPRAYDADDALSNATDAFWLGGYSGTSLDTLSDATGMNRPSLYAAFGDKHALYLNTLDRYVEAGVQGMHVALRDDIPLAQALQRARALSAHWWRATRMLSDWHGRGRIESR